MRLSDLDVIVNPSHYGDRWIAPPARGGRQDLALSPASVRPVRRDLTSSQAWVITAIDNEAWRSIDYTLGDEAEVAECPYGDGHRLVVRRTRIVGAQAELFANWRYHAFITDRTGTAVALDADHRAHAVVELAIRDLKDGARLTHCPSGRFHANGAWAVLATVAHNLLRWVHLIGTATTGPVVATTLRRRLVSLPGRITRGSRRQRLHLPTRWPRATDFNNALNNLRAIPLRC